MSATTRTETGNCGYALDADGLVSWDPVHAEAWIGLLETHKRLTRALDAELESEFGLTISGVELLGRLAAAEGHSLGLSSLAAHCGLSLSRVSRIVDALVVRGLVERRTVETDGRAVQGHLTDAGLELVQRAQASHFASVERRFFAELSEAQITALGEIFAKFAGADACTATAREDSLAGR